MDVAEEWRDSAGRLRWSFAFEIRMFHVPENADVGGIETVEGFEYFRARGPLVVSFQEKFTAVLLADFDELFEVALAEHEAFVLGHCFGGLTAEDAKVGGTCAFGEACVAFAFFEHHLPT